MASTTARSSIWCRNRRRLRQERCDRRRRSSAWLEVPHVAGLALPEYTLSFCFQADRLPPRGEDAVLLSKDTHDPEGGLSIELITSATTGQTRLRIYIAVAGTAVWLGGTAGKRKGSGGILAEVAHHVAVVLNGSGVKLYLDGGEISADPPMTGWTANARRISVLAWDGSDGWFDGIFDELVIYDHGLTEREIADLARAKDGAEPGHPRRAGRSDLRCRLRDRVALHRRGRRRGRIGGSTSR